MRVSHCAGQPRRDPLLEAQTGNEKNRRHFGRKKAKERRRGHPGDLQSGNEDLAGPTGR